MQCYVVWKLLVGDRVMMTAGGTTAVLGIDVQLVENPIQTLAIPRGRDRHRPVLR
jgi:hypothetical protein